MLDHLAIQCADVARSARFYDAVLAEHPQLAERIVFMSGGAFTPRLRKFAAGNNARADVRFTADGAFPRGTLSADAPVAHQIIPAGEVPLAALVSEHKPQ